MKYRSDGVENVFIWDLFVTVQTQVFQDRYMEGLLHS